MPRSYQLPKGHLSFSQIRKYHTCPACYEAEYVDGIRPPISSALLIGIAAHAAVEDQRRAQLAGDAWNLSRARTVAHDAVRDKVHEAGGQGAEIQFDNFSNLGRLLEAATHVALQSCRVAWAYDRQRPIVAVEQELPCSRPGSVFPFSFIARADAVHGDGGYSDLKTLGWWKRERDAWALGQMAAYSIPGYLANRLIPRCDVLVVEKKELSRLAWYPATPTLDHMRRMFAQIVQVAIDISRGHFPARPNRWCHLPHPAGDVTTVARGW
jgi:PD-(D/E)XK nuclease superfamily